MYKKYFVPFSLILIYLVSHLWQLTLLPVFADESIYIRWAQLIMDDWKQYLFFPLNDGKTPLFIWSLIPFQYLFQDQLFAARFVSVMVGLLQLFVTKEIVKVLGGRTKAQWLSMLMVSVLPFWYIYHRFALMDGMMTLLISLTIWATIKLVNTKINSTPSLIKWSLGIGVFLGLGIWTKLPAVFVVPALPFFVLLERKFDKPRVVRLLLAMSGSVLLGFFIFALLRISPAFGQLFRRTSDFAFPINEVLFQGKWQETLASVPNYFLYFFYYLTWPVLVLSLAGIFSKKNRRVSLVFLAVVAAFSGFFFLFGRVVYSRYFLAVALPFTVLTSLNAQALFDKYFTKELNLAKKTGMAVVITILFGSMLSQSLHTIVPALSNPDTIPFVSSDQDQYLNTWAAGRGIPETVQYIRTQSQNHSIAVATEGRFGTLPDGLLLYFHGQNLSHIYIEGTEEYPVKSLPDFFVKRAKEFDQSILVVNSDRMELKLDPSKRIAQYCRPLNGTCLQIWDITQEVKNTP